MNFFSIRLQRKILLFSLFTCLFYTVVSAQLNTGPLSGSVFSDDNAIGVYTFSSPGNAAASDNIRTSASAILALLSGNTHYLKVSGFGFTVPTGATITGIVAEVEKSASNISILSTVTDNSVRLIKGGTIVGNDYTTSVEWPTPETYYSYGSSSDLWGTSWSVAEINSANFGIAFSASLSGIISLLPSARIDHIRVTVYYNLSVLPLDITHFGANVLNEHSVRLQWTTSHNDEAAEFNIQKSPDGHSWATLYTQRSEVTTTDKEYQYTDADCLDEHSYYRLQVKHASGRVSYSPVIRVNFAVRPLSIYPNPAIDYILLQYKENVNMLECFSPDGKKWPLKYVNTGNDLLKINISHLPRGYYIIGVNGKKKIFVKN